MTQNFQIVVNLGAQQKADDKRMHQLCLELGVAACAAPSRCASPMADKIFNMAINQILCLAPDFGIACGEFSTQAGVGAAASVAIFGPPLFLRLTDIITPESQTFQRGILFRKNAFIIRSLICQCSS